MDRAYRELGVAPGAPESEVKAAYRKLVLQFHPDRHLSSSPSEQAAAAHRFKVVTEAYDFVTNPNERLRSSYGASSSGTSSSSSSSAYHNVNTDWSHSYYEPGSRGGYTSTISRWEWWRRAARHGMRSFSHTLHVGLAVLLVGGGLMFEASHTALWQARNKGKTFEDVQAAVQAAKQKAESFGAPAAGSEEQPAKPQQQQQVYHIRSSWADSMRGRRVTEEEVNADAAR